MTELDNDIQGTEDWFNARKGKITCSRLGDVLASPKTQRYREYMQQLIDERLGAPIFPDWKGEYLYAIRRGKDLERQAIGLYELMYQVDVDRPGFILSTDIPQFGGSPDLLVNADGGGEVKVALGEKTHHKRLEQGMEAKHKPQVQGLMMVTGRKWWDFISYCPLMNGKDKIFVQRIDRDEDYIVELRKAVIEFNRECNERLNLLESST